MLTLVSLGARFLYQGKNGHGPFAGFAIGAAGYSYELFYPSGTSMNAYDHRRSSGTTDLWRMELGYHWNSKPLYFKKVWDNHISGQDLAAMKQKGWSVRLQPLIGAAYHLVNDEGRWVESTQNGVLIREEYLQTNRKGNFALIGGLGFEFGKNDKKRFTLSLNYIRGLGQSITRSKLTINTSSGNYEGLLGSNGTGFTVMVGVPIRIWRKKR